MNALQERVNGEVRLIRTGGSPATVLEPVTESVTEPVKVGESEDEYVFAASTTDYGVFVLDLTNRPVDPDKVKALKASILQANRLRSYPIVVAVENGEWKVRDGQHRLVAAKELGVPIYYTFNNDMSAEDVAVVNAAQNSWKMTDYMHHYCARGFPEYLKLQAFHTRYPWLSLNTASDLCTYGDRAVGNKMFKEGGYQCNDLDFAEQVAQAVLQFSRWISFYREAVFVSAVAQLFEHEGYSHERMMQKMEFMSTSLVKCVNIDQYMQVFNAIYNKQAREKDRLRIAKIPASSRRRRGDRRFRNAR